MSLGGYTALLPGILILTADQGLKQWVTFHIRGFGQESILGQHRLFFCHYLNRRASGGLSGNWNARDLPTLIWGALFLTAAIRFQRASQWERVSYGLLLAGGASNLIDVWRVNSVIDSLSLVISYGRFIPFNLADLSISGAAAGLSILLVYRMVSDSGRSRRASSGQTPNHYQSR